MSAQVQLKETSSAVNTSESAIPWGWIAMGIFALSSTLNFLDRQLLAAVAPTIKLEFGLSNAQYGALLSAFSLAYMLMVPFAGLLIDRVGLNTGIMISVAAWSLAGSSAGLVQTFSGLLMVRMALGAAETGGIPASSKAVATYLKPREMSFGLALQSGGLSLGAIVAPLVAALAMPRYGWREAFIICGGAGFVWLLVWWCVAKIVPARSVYSGAGSANVADVLKDGRIWGLLVTNVLIMTVHSLWSNWTTVYFVQERNLTPLQANQYFAWIPPVFATVGAFFGGWLAFRSIRDGVPAVAARVRICRALAPTLLITAVIPFTGSPSAAAAAISLSFFLCMTMLSNLHVLPIDLFGAKHAAFTSALLAFSYALLQAVISPVIGAMVDGFGFSAVFVSLSVLPLVGMLVLHFSMKQSVAKAA